MRLEFSAEDRQGLLADVTRTFREHGLNVTGADISTERDMAVNEFYVTDAIGNTADSKLIEAVRQKIGLSNLKVKELLMIFHKKVESEEQPVGVGGAVLLSLGSLVRRNLYNLGRWWNLVIVVIVGWVLLEFGVALFEEGFELKEGETGGKSKRWCCWLGEFVGYRGYCWQAQRKVVGR